MKTSPLFVAVFVMLLIGACKPSEPDAPVVPAGPPVAEVPEETGEVEAMAEAADTEPADAEVADAEVADAEVADTEAADTEAADTEPADMEPTDTEPADAAAPTVQTWDFEDAEAGGPPSGWSVEKTGEGPGSEWKVLEDESAPAGPKVLGQVSLEGPSALFCLCIADETSYTDVDLSVAMKGVDGKIDQGGGPVWRLQDENNYYVARMNPLESNFRLYKVIDGKRTKLASGEVYVPAEDIGDDDALLNKWHTIRVVHRGDNIRCFLNGEPSLEFTDSSIPDAGKIGLWVKADAVTSFDGLTAAAPAE